MRCNGSESGDLSSSTPPLGDLDALEAGLFEFDFKVREVSLEGTSWTGDGDGLAFYDQFDILTKVLETDIVDRVDGFHGCSGLNSYF